MKGMVSTMKKWNLYTTNEIKPLGWMRRQLEVQAEGLSGNLHKIWPDVRDSAWIGGDRDGWERVPYWLDGFIPLAYLLENEEMIATVKKYIDAILSFQKEDGWICPCSDEGRKTYDTWAVLLITKVLTVYYESSGDERIPDVLYRVLRNYYGHLKNGDIQLFEGGKYRWFEGFIAINFVYERCREPWLLELAEILREQGTDYRTVTHLWERPLNKWTFDTHIVNIGMMLKAEAVSCDLFGEEYTDTAEYLRSILDKYNGTVYGSFTGDECLSGISSIQGTELCAIMEQMYSYELLYAYTGDSKWAERLEILAFNALPATFSDDMWAHQYVQMANQIACRRFPGKPIFRTNGEEAHIFGLQPNYGCCTANLSQGFPKLALSAFMYSGDTVLNAVQIPSSLKSDGISISLETNYPFEYTFKYEIEADKPFKFMIRIPSFARGVGGVGAECETDGEYMTFNIAPGKTSFTVGYEVSPKLEDRPNGLKNAKYGSLVFALPIKYSKEVLEFERYGVERKKPYCDYHYIPESEWEYAFACDSFEVDFKGISNIPFSSDEPPVTLKAKMCRVDWGYEDGYEDVCAKLPNSREAKSSPVEIELYPYGCAKLRMTEMPLAE